MYEMSQGAEARPSREAMCSCIVLLEDKRICSNVADHWQQFLHQQYFLITLPVDCSTGFNENQVGITEL